MSPINVVFPDSFQVFIRVRREVYMRSGESLADRANDIFFRKLFRHTDIPDVVYITYGLYEQYNAESQRERENAETGRPRSSLGLFLMTWHLLAEFEALTQG